MISNLEALKFISVFESYQESGAVFIKLYIIIKPFNRLDDTTKLFIMKEQ